MLDTEKEIKNYQSELHDLKDKSHKADTVLEDAAAEKRSDLMLVQEAITEQNRLLKHTTSKIGSLMNEIIKVRGEKEQQYRNMLTR